MIIQRLKLKLKKLNKILCRNISTDTKSIKTIKRKNRSGDVLAHHEKMSSKKYKNNASSSSGTQNVLNVNNNNYFAPLQTVDIDDLDDDHIATESKPKIAPITILKCKIEEIHELCLLNKVTDYSIRKISIGLKLFCSTKQSCEVMCNAISGKYEFFSYATKDEKPYKALLFGLDSQDPNELKNKLCSLGLNCHDVKIVHKKNQYATYVIFVVYLQRKSITIKELRQKFDVIDYVKVKWDYQTTKRNKITQCYNCQMFGHGSSHCKVKTFCANCAGNHLTKDCTESVAKCANCNGPHKSTDDKCPSKSQYINVKQRNQPLNRKRNLPTVVNNMTNFPNTLRQDIPMKPRAWPQPRDTINSTQNADLFSISELQTLTFELIANLKNCKTKLDQFEVITNLACKFLS